MPTKFERNENLETHFQQIKNQAAKAIDNPFYFPKMETRDKCNSSQTGLGAALEQRSPTARKTSAFACVSLIAMKNDIVSMMWNYWQ